MFLCDDHPKGISGCIGMHSEWLRPVRCFQHRFAGTDILQPVESVFAFLRPIPLLVFTCQVIERSCNIGKVRNEGSVEITEAEEALDVFDTRRSWPLRDTFNLDRIHMYLPV